MAIPDLNATDRALATIQAGLSGGMIKLCGTQGGATPAQAAENDAAYLTALLAGLVTAIKSGVK